MKKENHVLEVTYARVFLLTLLRSFEGGADLPYGAFAVVIQTARFNLRECYFMLVECNSSMAKELYCNSLHVINILINRVLSFYYAFRVPDSLSLNYYNIFEPSPPPFNKKNSFKNCKIVACWVCRLNSSWVRFALRPTPIFGVKLKF